MSITRGAVLEIASMRSPVSPIVQVLEIRSLAVPAAPGGVPGNDRYKIKISDGTHFMQAMLTTNQNALVTSKTLVENSLIRLTEFICNVVSDRKICIIVELEVLSVPSYSRAGNPVAVETAGAVAAPEPSYAPPAPAPRAAPAAYGGAEASAYGGGSRAYGAVATSSDVRHVPVASLNPYSNKWTIKVRVTAKGERRTWSNARGEGSLFSVELLDQYGTQIRGTFFKEGVDKFYDVVQKDKVFFMSNGRLKAANKQYTSITNDYEISFDGHATVIPAPEDAAIKHEQYAFVPIASLQDALKDTTVDVIGIAKTIGASSDFTSKAGKALTKREVTLVDTSAASISLTLWGDKAASITEASEGAVLAVKGARVGDFAGKSLSTSMSSSIVENPAIAEARALQAWWAAEGSTAAITAVTVVGGSGGGGMGPTTNVAARKSIAAIKSDPMMGSGGEGDIFTVKATVNFVKSDGDKMPWYPACPEANCNKKAIQSMAGTDWQCEKCNISFPEPSYRYILSATAVDHTGAEFVTLFNAEATTLLDGNTASSMFKVKQEGEAGAGQWASVFQRAHFKQFLFRMKAKREMVNDQSRLKVSVLAMRPVEFPKESRALLDAIKAYA